MLTTFRRRQALLAAVAASAALLLSACGDDDTPNVESVASFGDSLSDLGTFQWGAVAAAGGGRYTTNSPGTIWVEEVARAYGTTIARSRTGGAGNPAPSVSTGTGYAQGGARITQLPGVGSTPTGVAGVSVESAALPVRDQVTAHLATVGGRIPPRQLILILAGANDLFFQLGVFQATVGDPGCTAPCAAQAQAAAVQAASTAGAELAGEVRRLLAAGAEKIVLSDAPDPALTPFGAASGAQAQALMTGLAQAFNSAMATALGGDASRVTRVDFNAFVADVNGRPGAYGLSNITAPACNFPTPQNPSSLFCSAATLVAPGAESTYLFADGVHPTTGGHRAFARWLLERVQPVIPR
jgi:phospholipase/lecithinase/hemolysin